MGGFIDETDQLGERITHLAPSFLISANLFSIPNSHDDGVYLNISTPVTILGLVEMVWLPASIDGEEVLLATKSCHESTFVEIVFPSEVGEKDKTSPDESPS
jgi:hypothetical protein